ARAAEPRVAAWHGHLRRRGGEQHGVEAAGQLGTLQEHAVDQQHRVLRRLDRVEVQRPVGRDVVHRGDDLAARAERVDDAATEGREVERVPVVRLGVAAVGVAVRTRVVEAVEADPDQLALRHERREGAQFGRERRFADAVGPVDADDGALARPHRQHELQQVGQDLGAGGRRRHRVPRQVSVLLLRRALGGRAAAGAATTTPTAGCAVRACALALLRGVRALGARRGRLTTPATTAATTARPAALGALATTTVATARTRTSLARALAGLAEVLERLGAETGPGALAAWQPALGALGDAEVGVQVRRGGVGLHRL